jgi:hypothetical protein
VGQFARPEADILIGQWEDDGGGFVDLFDAINEVTASDADFIRSETIEIPTDGSDFTTEETLTSAYVTKLSTVLDPGIDTGFKIRFRISKNVADGLPTSLFMELRQDYEDETLQGTLIAARAVGDISETNTDFEFELTEDEAGLITDFGNLFLRFQFAVA